MQKKLIAIAVAGLVSAPVFAQSNVTIYGIADMGLVVNGKYRSGTTHVDGGQKTRLDSGVASGSRLGFKGTEDLGNGLKALFTIEAGIDVDTGGINQGTTWGRQSIVGLTGGFGTFIMGRMYTPQHLMNAKIDPFGLGFAGNLGNIFNNVARVNNAAAYVSPSFGGFNVIAAYATNALAEDSATSEKKYGRTVAINPNYANGPVYVGLNYHEISDATVGDPDAKVKNLSAGGTFNFGAAKLHAGYGQNKSNNGTTDTTKNATWMLGVTVPVGAFNILASYANLNDKTAANADARQMAVGATYALSKRTDVYTAYARIKNKNGATLSVGNATDSGAGNESQFNLGLRHTF
ncbi:MAG: porin [Betaproteobacteria bacterium]|nr:porin [Betaproteobacteria bacterium]